MLYGLGNILGAGIYVLVGEVAAASGTALLLAFVVAGVVALLTAITYAALAAEYPQSAGAALYVQKAFGGVFFSRLIGLLLAFSGVISAGVLLNGFANYALVLFAELPRWVPIITVLAALTAVAYRGISGSARLAVVFTLIEVAGLLIIVYIGFVAGDHEQVLATSLNLPSTGAFEAIMTGAFLAFYAYIGFEDMVNIAEEVKDPKRSMYRGVIGSVVLATIFYLLVGWAALAVLSPAELAQSNAPLSAVFERGSTIKFPLITIIGLFAIINGVLAQIIMSSRVLYGLSKQNQLPSILSKVSSRYQTPTIATVIVAAIMLVGALSFPLSTLARTTSFLLICIFIIVQLAALKLISGGKLSHLPIFIPLLGLVLNAGIIAYQVARWLY